MLRPQRHARWLTVALAVLCAVQGVTLGTAHHVCCGHASHLPHLVACHGWCDGCVPKEPQWDHRHPAAASPAHDAQNCLACRHVAQRCMLPRIVRVDSAPAFVESPQAAAPILAAAAAPASYDSRAPPV
ncbi:MAG TPA: hypothetical protein PLF81_00565 [Candidatus Anammoximicrobium sp.]|nr:hypothetical protein [Candidatus Anammoximicrobium sp.]